MPVTNRGKSHMFDSNEASKSHKLAHKKHGDGFEAPRNSLDISINPSKGHHNVTQDVPMKQRSSKTNYGSNGTPIKKLIDGEISRRTNESQAAPSIIARLMGMDSIPESCLNVHAKDHEVDRSRRSTEMSIPLEICSELGTSRRSTSSRKIIKKSLLLNGNRRDSKTERTSKPQPRQHPQEKLLQKFKKDFEEWQASKLWENPRPQKNHVLGDRKNNQALAQEILNKERMAKYLEANKTFAEKIPTGPETKDVSTDITVVDTQHGCSLQNYGHLNKQCHSLSNNNIMPVKLEAKSNNLECIQSTKTDRRQERSSSPTRIVILKPNFGRLDGNEESLSATSDKSEKECSMEDFLEEVKARLRNEVQEKSGSNIEVRQSGITTSFSERSVDPKQIARNIAKKIRESVTKDMGTTLMRSDSTRSIQSEIQINAVDSPEFIRRDTRKFLYEKSKNVLKGGIVVEKHLINYRDSGASSLIKEKELPKFMSNVSNKGENVKHWKDKKAVSESNTRHIQEAVSLDSKSELEINLVRSFSAPVTGTAFGKLLIDEQHITGAQIRRKHEAFEYNFSKVREHRKDSFNFKETVFNVKHNLGLKGKLFGKKNRLIKEPNESEFNAVNELLTVPPIVTGTGIAQDNSTDVPPSPVSVSSSSPDEFCRHANPSPISPLEVMEYHTSPCISEDLSFNTAEPHHSVHFENDKLEITEEEQPNKRGIEMESKDDAYLRDILVTAGFYEDRITDQANIKLDALTRPISHRVFEEVEEAYGKYEIVDSESFIVHNDDITIGHKLLYDLVNEALQCVLGPKIKCSMFKRWILGPAASPLGKNILDDLWNRIQLHLQPSVDEPCTLGNMVVQDLKMSTWPTMLYEDMDIVGRQIERIILHNLINEMVFNHFFSHNGRFMLRGECFGWCIGNAISSGSSYISGRSEEETCSHIFYHCNFSQQVWTFLAAQSNFSWFAGVNDLHPQWLANTPDITSCTLMLISFWQIWKMRNAVTFQEEIPNVSKTGRAILADYNDHILANNRCRHSGLSFFTTYIKWSKPNVGVLKINTDGAWDKDLQRGGIGYVIRDHNATTIAAVAAYLECDSPLFAEIMAICSALAYIHCQSGFQNATIIFKSDSKEAMGLRLLEME